MSLKRYGTYYSGFFYPEGFPDLDASSIVYCVGAGEDISHDIEIASSLGSDIHIFDPTPRAIDHVKLVKGFLETGVEPLYKSQYGGGDPNYWKYISKYTVPTNKVHLHPYGLHTTDNASMRFYQPSNTSYVSHSLIDGMKGTEYITVEVKSLKTIMRELGHTKIDILKIDIEGSECDVLDMMCSDLIFPRYLSVDFDLAGTGERMKNMGRCKTTIDCLYKYGYTLLKSEGYNISFQHQRLNLEID